MKKKVIGLMAVALAGVLVLTACSSSNQNSGAQGAGGAANSGTADNGTANGGAADNGAANGGTADNGTANGGAADNGAANGGAADNGTANGGAADNGAANDSAVQEDIWSGTYMGDEETVTLTKRSDTTIAFSFAQSGISGNAELNGAQAVYMGDDDHVITFGINGTILEVAVSSESEPGVIESPLNGTFVKEA